jgi:hypothetical protein
MAEEDNNEAAEQGANEEAKAPKKGGKAVKLLGGLVALMATGSVLAMMAIPSKADQPRMTGPFEFKFFELDDNPNVVTNTRDDNFSRYVKFEPTTTVFAYDEAYPSTRRAETGFLTAMRNAMSRIVVKYELDHIFENSDVFNEELRQAAEPILFPVCFGDASSSFMADPVSGLMPGDSQETSGTFRGDFYENSIQIDGARGTLQINADGLVQSFNGDERNLMVEDRNGKVIFVDVTGVDETYTGSIQIGVKGRIRRLTATFTAQ